MAEDTNESPVSDPKKAPASDPKKAGEDNGSFVNKSKSVWDQYLRAPVEAQPPNDVSGINSESEDDSDKTEEKQGSAWDKYLFQPIEPLVANTEDAKIQETEKSQNQTPILAALTGFSDTALGKLNEIQGQLDDLRKEFRGKLKYDVHKDKMIDTLHNELQKYKQDIIKRYLKPVIFDLIKVVDDIRKLTNHYNSQNISETDPAKLLNLLDTIPTDIEEIFYRQGIIVYSGDSNEFEPTRQKILNTIEIDDVKKDKTVAESLRPGYEWDGQILRPEMVNVYIYKGTTADTQAKAINEQGDDSKKMQSKETDLKKEMNISNQKPADAEQVNLNEAIAETRNSDE